MKPYMEPNLKPWRTRKRNPKWKTKKTLHNPNETLNETENDILKKPKPHSKKLWMKP